MGTGIERIVLDFVHAAYGEHMDVEAMTALMADDFMWQLNVPLSPIIRGRDAARAELKSTTSWLRAWSTAARFVRSFPTKTRWW